MPTTVRSKKRKLSTELNLSSSRTIVGESGPTGQDSLSSKEVGVKFLSLP